jgi:hypothetical protein
VWFYDGAAGAQTLYGLLTLLNSKVPYPQPGFRVSVGVQDFDGARYHVYAPDIANYKQTTVPRTVGWHHFLIRVNQNNGEIRIDGALVHTFNASFTFDQIVLEVFGPSWRPNATYAWDEFSFSPITVN